MASFVPNEKTKNDFNKGIKYENGDGVQAETINNLIESQLFVQGIATNQPKVVEDNTEGSPTVYFENKDGLQRFVFQNIKGKDGKGEKGDNGNIMRFVDGPLSDASSVSTTTTVGISHILNPEKISVGDLVLDPYYKENPSSGDGYLCIWQITSLNTKDVAELKGLGYVLAPKGVDGKTPYIDGGDWYIGEVYQGRAEGFSPTIEVVDKGDGEHWIYITDVNTVGTPDPIKIKEGKDGVGIKSIDQTTENTGSSELNVIKVYDDNNKEIGSFNIRNGGRGEKGDTITGIVQSVVSEVDGGTNQIKVMVSNGQAYTFEYKNGSKGQKGDNGNIMRFTDSALYYRSDVGVTTNISASNLINGGDVAQGDVVLDTHYTQGEEYYICIWEVTQVSSTAQGVVISLRGMGYVTSSKGGTVKIEVDKALSETSENPVQNKVVTTALNTLNKTLSLSISTLDEDITDIKTGEVVVNKAENDSNGNKIISTYATKSEANARAKTIEYSWENKGTDGVNPFKLNLTLKDANGNQLSTTQIDFPLEQMVIDAEYDKDNKQLILKLPDTQFPVPVADIFDGLVTDSNIGGKTAGKAKVLETARTITIQGDATGSYSFDGSADKSIELTVPRLNPLENRVGTLETDIAKINAIEEILETKADKGNSYVDNSVAYLKFVPKNVAPYAKLNIFSSNNLLNTYSAQNNTTNGITYTVNADGTISAKGTCSGGHAYLNMPTITVSQECYLSGSPNGAGSTTYMLRFLSTGGVYYYDYGSGVNIPVGTYTPQIVVRTGNTVDIVFKPMLNVGSSALPYEPYIPKVTTVKSVGKNLHNFTTDTFDYYIDPNIGIYPASGAYYTDYIPVKPSTTYTYSNTISYTYFYDSNKQQISFTLDKSNFTTPSNCSFIRASGWGNTWQVCEGREAPTDLTYKEYILTIAEINNGNNAIAVEGGGVITFENQYGLAVPSEVTFYYNPNELVSANKFVGDLLGTALNSQRAKYADVANNATGSLATRLGAIETDLPDKVSRDELDSIFDTYMERYMNKYILSKGY